MSSEFTSLNLLALFSNQNLNKIAVILATTIIVYYASKTRYGHGIEFKFSCTSCVIYKSHENNQRPNSLKNVYNE